MRYLVDDIDRDSIMAMAVGPKQMILSDMAPDPEAEHPVSLLHIWVTMYLFVLI